MKGEALAYNRRLIVYFDSYEGKTSILGCRSPLKVPEIRHAARSSPCIASVVTLKLGLAKVYRNSMLIYENNSLYVSHRTWVLRQQIQEMML